MTFERPQQDYRRVLVTTMKDEAPYMLDWVSYHLAIGFTHFVILSNDCSDGTDKISRKLERAGLVTHKNNPPPHPRGPQKTGYQRMRKLEAVQNANWLMALDVDEYLRLNIGDGTLDALFALCEEKPKAYSFVWQLFGNNDVECLSETPVYDVFLHSSHPLQARPYECLPIKTLFQNKYFEKIGTHRPVDLRPENADDFLWVDADGVPMFEYYLQRHWRSYENGLGFGCTLGRVEHYALRSLEAFMVKWERGFVHPDAPTVRGKGTPPDYWKLFNWNQYKPKTSLPLREKASKIKEQLLNLENIRKLEKNGFDWHKMRAETLKNEQIEMYNSLLLMGSSKIDEEMPDFSEFGSPRSFDIPYLPQKNILMKARQKSILDLSIVQKAYENL